MSQLIRLYVTMTATEKQCVCHTVRASFVIALGHTKDQARAVGGIYTPQDALMNAKGREVSVVGVASILPQRIIGGEWSTATGGLWI